MSILNFSKRKNSTKPIEVFYAWGDQEPTYEWGCIVAQEMYIERSLRVFKTCASTGNFLKGYNGEECIFLTGLIDQDMLQYEFMRFLCGGKLQRFENIELSNVRVIIITARQMPLDWDFHDAYEQMDMLYSFEVFDHMYEVRTKGSDKVSIYEYETEYGKRPQHITLHESVDLNALSLMQNIQSVDYFEKLPILEYVSGSEHEKEKFISDLDCYSAFEKRKMCALLSVHCEPVSINKAKQLVKNLDQFFYLGYIQNYRDFGCYFIYDVNESKEIANYSLYFDFESYAEDIDRLERDNRAYLDHITKYGYICGIESSGWCPYLKYEE